MQHVVRVVADEFIPQTRVDDDHVLISEINQVNLDETGVQIKTSFVCSGLGETSSFLGGRWQVTLLNFRSWKEHFFSVGSGQQQHERCFKGSKFKCGP